MSSTDTFRDCNVRELAEQIGGMNIMAISGGRMLARPTGLTLPVSNSYSVTVDLNWDDTYVVRRMWRDTIKGEQRNVYCNEVGEVAYIASCFRNREFGEGA